MVSKQGTISLGISQINFSGTFDYEKFYLAIYNWLADHYYDVSEVYKHKMTGSGAEVELTVKGERKESEFFKQDVEVETKIWGMTDVEVMKEGKKQKLNKARMTVTIKIKGTLDYTSEFDKSEFLIRLFNILRFTLMKDRIMLAWMGKFIGEVYRLQTKIKEELGMYTAYNAW